MSDTQHSPLKKRIVGAIVLVSLAVIFIPMFFSGEKPHDDGMPIFGSNIPDQPDNLAQLETKKLEPAVPQPDIKPVSSLPVEKNTPKIKPDDIQVVTPARNKTTTSKKSKQDKPNQAKPIKATSATAWAVQVASFSSRKNALKLRDRLRGKSFNSFVEAFKTQKGLRYRVRVGPEVRKSDADKKRKLIKKQFKLSGLVVRHN